MNNRYGDWCQTFLGKKVYPLDPREDEIEIVDIAHALSMMCRYNGHCLRFYSVAEHCCHVSDYIGRTQSEHALWGLLHDASEAYLADIIRPVKPWLEGYWGIENRLMECICLRFGLPLIQPDIVKEIDTRILGNERDQVMAPPPEPWYAVGEPLPGVRIWCWTPERARTEFLARFEVLTS